MSCAEETPLNPLHPDLAGEMLPGSIVVDPNPYSLNAPWTLTGPNSYNTSGNGDQTLTGMAFGDYTLNWGAVSGRTSPANATGTLVAGGTVMFSGTYSEFGQVFVMIPPVSVSMPGTFDLPRN